MVLHDLMRRLASLSAVFVLAVGGHAFAQGRPDVFTTLPWSWTGQQTFGSTIHGVSTQTGQAYTFAPSDCSSPINFTNNTSVTATVPNTMPAGCDVFFVQLGAGQVTVVAGAGATLRPNPHGFTGTAGQNDVSGIHVDSNPTGTAAAFELIGGGPGTGPPPLQPPPQAAAAGFTALAFNSDFSQPQYANALNNSWLCNRTTDDGSHVCQWYYGIWWSGAVALDGDGNSTVGQLFDPTIGQNVMGLTWKKAYCPAFFATPSQCTAAFQVIETVSLADQGEAITPQLAEAFPSNNAYIEWRYRDNLLSLLDGNDTSALVWWARCAFNSNTCGAIGGSSFNEIDIDENYANHCGDGGSGGICAQSLQACHGWGGATCSGGMANATWVYPTIGDPNFNNYHTLGVLITSAGGGTATECSYIDDVRQGCLPFQNGDAANRSSLELAGGMTTFGALVPSTNDEHMYIQFVRVWSCPAWNTTDPARQCNQVIPPNGPNQIGQTWTNSGATQSATTAPDGSPAIKITQDTSNGIHGIVQTGSFTNATSILQANIAPGVGAGATNVGLDVSGGAGGTSFAGAFFNPTTGAVNSTFVDSPASQVVAANTIPISGNCSPAPNCGFTAYIVVNLGSAPNLVFVGAGTNGIGDGSSSATTWRWFFETGQTPIP